MHMHKYTSYTHTHTINPKHKYKHIQINIQCTHTLTGVYLVIHESSKDDVGIGVHVSIDHLRTGGRR
ncbi:hypothetical protein EON63_10685 [archaeon]|nr:MAG: hypothetical protein EON63_10685 [archaeon]